MTQAAFLALPHVERFTAFLINHLSAEGYFEHRYRHRKSRADWDCNSLYEAFKKYDWNGEDYEQTSKKLKPLAEELRRSVRENDNAACQAACVGILDWGGVGKQKPTNITALDTLAEKHGSLPAYFEKVQADLVRADFSTATSWDGIKMNSGYTKLYAMLFEDFIIYDSRVGAALGLLVRHWCVQEGLDIVPKELRFAFKYVPGGTAVRQSRNPSYGSLTFGPLRSDRHHTEHNMWANWLLTAVVAQLTPTSPLREQEARERLRAVEAALFMIGYDVRPSAN